MPGPVGGAAIPAADEKATSSESGTERTPRRRRRRCLRAALLALLPVGLLPVCFWVFGNAALHSQSWTRERLDGSIRRGLEYLCTSGAFAKSIAEGGESPPHFFFLESVLVQREDACLRDHIALARQKNRDDLQWRAFFGMPGWPRHELTGVDEAWIRRAVSLDHENYWAQWLVHALYPSWTNLRPQEHERLFGNTAKLRNSYHLTHALIVYLWMRELHPEEAERRKVPELIGQVNERLLRAQTWDLFTSDIYNERVAFWLYMQDGPTVRRRWIERILLSQNEDGGWTYDRSIARMIGQLVGYDHGRWPSDPHATFLALYALSHYADD